MILPGAAAGRRKRPARRPVRRCLACATFRGGWPIISTGLEVECQVRRRLRQILLPRIRWPSARCHLSCRTGRCCDLACGTSGSALLASGRPGRRVTAVDISEVALGLLGEEARRARTRPPATTARAEPIWRHGARSRSVIRSCCAPGYWDSAVSRCRRGWRWPAGGLLGWEAFTAEARRARPWVVPRLVPGSRRASISAPRQVHGPGPAGPSGWRVQHQEETAGPGARLAATAQ